MPRYVIRRPGNYDKILSDFKMQFPTADIKSITWDKKRKSRLGKMWRIEFIEKR